MTTTSTRRIDQALTGMGFRFDFQQVDGPREGWDADASHWDIDLWRDGITTPYMFTLRYSMGSAHTGTPELSHVIWCLFMDCLDPSSSFEEWCEEYGYDSDSRRAEGLYDECRRNMASLRTMLQPGDMDTLTNLFKDF